MQYDVLLYSVREMSDLMGCSKQTIINRLQEKKIKSVLVKNRTGYYNSEQLKLINDKPIKETKINQTFFIGRLTVFSPYQRTEVWNIYKSKMNQN